MLEPKAITDSTIHQAAGRTIPSVTWSVLIFAEIVWCARKLSV